MEIYILEILMKWKKSQIPAEMKATEEGNVAISP
jgi:hypothetical protein